MNSLIRIISYFLWISYCAITQPGIKYLGRLGFQRALIANDDKSMGAHSRAAIDVGSIKLSIAS